MTSLAPITKIRLAGRATFASMLHEHIRAAARRGVALVPSWHARLSISEQHIRRWADELVAGRAPMACGDVDALDPVDALDLLERWKETIEARLRPVAPARDPEHEVLALATLVGEAAREAQTTVAGGVNSWEREERRFEEIERRARQAKLAARAARGAL